MQRIKREREIERERERKMGERWSDRWRNMKYNCGKCGKGTAWFLLSFTSHPSSAIFLLCNLFTHRPVHVPSIFGPDRLLVRLRKYILFIINIIIIIIVIDSGFGHPGISCSPPLTPFPRPLPQNCYCRKFTLEMQPHCSLQGERGGGLVGGWVRCIKTIIQS